MRLIAGIEFVRCPPDVCYALFYNVHSDDIKKEMLVMQRQDEFTREKRQVRMVRHRRPDTLRRASALLSRPAGVTARRLPVMPIRRARYMRHADAAARPPGARRSVANAIRAPSQRTDMFEREEQFRSFAVTLLRQRLTSPTGRVHG